MHRYIGIDAHSESCTLAVMGPSGKRLKEARLETNGQVLTDFVRSVAGQKHVCLEEAPGIEPRFAELQVAGITTFPALSRSDSVAYRRFASLLVPQSQGGA